MQVPKIRIIKRLRSSLNSVKTKRNLTFILALAIFLILTSINLVSAITINPNQYSISEVEIDKSYKIIITINNNDAQIFSIIPEIDPTSYYAKDIIKFNPQIISLNPLDKENINVEFKIPKDFPVGKHNIKVNFNSAGKTLTSFNLNLNIPGEIKISAKVNDLNINANYQNQPIYITLNIMNTGTTIIKPTPIVEIYKLLDSKEKKASAILGDKSTVTIMPNKDYNLSLMYDPSSLDEGTYTAISYLKYDNVNTEPIEKIFQLSSSESGLKEYHKIIKSPIGYDTSTKVRIKNDEDKTSFYQITYKIKDKEIYNTIQGELSPQEIKLIDLPLNTSSLDIGEYEIELSIRKGVNLEHKEENLIKIIIEEKSNLLLFIGVIVIIIGALIGLSKFALFKLKINVTDYFPNMKNRAIKSKGVKYISKDVKKISKKYEKIEKDYREVGDRINDFILKSNKWLEKEGFEERFN